MERFTRYASQFQTFHLRISLQMENLRYLNLAHLFLEDLVTLPGIMNICANLFEEGNGNGGGFA